MYTPNIFFKQEKRSVTTCDLQKEIQYNFRIIKKKLGLRIASLHKNAGLTQEKLAEKSNYSVELISFIEHGIHTPSIRGGRTKLLPL